VAAAVAAAAAVTANKRPPDTRGDAVVVLGKWEEDACIEFAFVGLLCAVLCAVLGLDPCSFLV
jgi:hypothetical protein